MLQAEGGAAACTVSHADLPAEIGRPLPYVTTQDTAAAFELLGCAPGYMHRGTLLRVLTSGELNEEPLTHAQACSVAQKLGIDVHQAIA